MSQYAKNKISFKNITGFSDKEKPELYVEYIKAISLQEISQALIGINNKLEEIKIIQLRAIKNK
jgi:hypothetical protein